jgi:hypothetical protein
MPAEKRKFDYDVTLSFAGEQRAVVERFATLLKEAGLEVFYDAWNKADLWGRDLYQHLDEIYSKKARFCVLFISADYAAKAWTNHELKSAQTRAFRENKEYILPVRLDDTGIPGMRETVGYLDLRKHTIEEVAEIAIQKIAATPTPSKPGSHAKKQKGGKAVAKRAGKGIVVDSSHNWILLADAFYKVQSVDRPDDKRFIISLATNDSASDSRLEELRTQRNSANRELSFAYANDAFVVRCESVTSSYEAGTQKWRLALLKEDIQYGGHTMESSYSDGTRHYTVEDLARSRAERILLGTTAAPAEKRGFNFDVSGHMLESFIQGTSTFLKVTRSPIQDLAKKMTLTDPASFLTFARLVSLFFLKAGDVVERVERLSLGPLKGNSVHVDFRGLRRKKAQNVDAAVIEVEGDCPLSRA